MQKYQSTQSMQEKSMDDIDHDDDLDYQQISPLSQDQYPIGEQILQNEVQRIQNLDLNDKQSVKMNNSAKKVKAQKQQNPQNEELLLFEKRIEIYTKESDDKQKIEPKISQDWIKKFTNVKKKK